MVTQTRTSSNPAKKRLAFNEKIISKGLTTDALLKKLKALHTELAEMDQELVDVGSLGSARSQLINTSILLHKDRGVKAYTACCLADILRLYAPDAPYTHTELRDIFQFFFRQLSAGLKGADSPYYNEYFHLLESLSTVKSVVLVCDLPHADELMLDIFREFFGLIRRDLPKKIEIFMADILVAIIDECQALPQDVLDTIMAQFMDKNARMDQPAYRLAVQICNATADKLQRHVCQYFTDIIVAHSHDEQFEEIQTAHDLVKQLSRSCPPLLQSVIPQLEEELRVEVLQVRLIATQALGDMFSEKGGADLVKKYPSTWNVWLMRKNDKSAAVRLKLVESAKGLLVNLPDIRDVIEDVLRSKLMDPDEKVRAAVCKVYSQLDYETALHHVSEMQLRSVAGRGLDKKHSVRVEALNSIGKLYSLAYPEIEIGDPAAIQQFSWIPGEVLCSSSAPEAKAVTEQVAADYLLPLPSLSSSTSKNSEIDDSAWTDRLLNTMNYLEDKATTVLLTISGIKANRPTVYEHYVQICVQNNGGIIDENEQQVKQRLANAIRYISRTFPDSAKAAEDLQTFADANEGRLYKLLKICMDTQTDLKGLIKASSEFLRRLEQSSSSIVPTMTVFLRRATLRIINQSSIPTLLKRLEKGGEASQVKSSRTLLTFVSKHCPALYKPHISELTKALADEKNQILIETSLQALASLMAWDNTLSVLDRRTTERVMRFVTESNVRHAKYAARLLAHSKEHDALCTELIESITDGLENAAPTLLVAHTAALTQFARLASDAFEHKSEDIMTFLVKKVLMVPSPPDPDEMLTDAEWIDKADIPPHLATKILSLKVCRNRCIALASSETALEISESVLRMFMTLLEHGGSFKADASDDPKVKSRLRLQAAVSLLHLATVEAYATAIDKNFMLLAITVQDACYNVREIFLLKLLSLLTQHKLSPRYNLIPFLTVHDPEADVKSRASGYMSFAMSNCPPGARIEQYEAIFIRFLHFLAHHPDFALDHGNLEEMAKYIDFYLSIVATVDNISLLYHLAMKAKTIRDAESHAYSENLYAMSELAQEIIKAFAASHSWSLQSYPGKVKLPADILRALPSAEAVNEIIKTVYLPEETVTWLKENYKGNKGAVTAKAKRPPKEHRSPPIKRKAEHKPRLNGQAKRARQAARWNSDQSESDEDPTSDSDSAEKDEGDTSDRRTPETDETVHENTENDDEEEEETTRGKELGRSARTRAKAKIRQQVKKNGKSKKG